MRHSVHLKLSSSCLASPQSGSPPTEHAAAFQARRANSQTAIGPEWLQDGVPCSCVGNSRVAPGAPMV
eukprot:14033969-Alexandrium_andersonii.AAC.1